ncbi:hypothetical protein FIA58_001450 [Flavobacterium jejuense]|uniref:Uncharacterized protein n=1 Tax=Flavobacterium jejuense TaxID=1544455 RepID=A0ABX0IQD0_9FLAO|nr:hypothetical protein [Flavobacterium jejuense]NHN24326.1 hypothetical protein [Flavobacterium jejuense]
MGEYIPLIKGEMEGFKIGLTSDLILWEHTKSLDYSKYHGEWLVGYGFGFQIGKNIRIQVKNNSGPKNFETNIKSILFLQNRIYNYGKFHDKLQIYLQNISNWNQILLQKETIENTKKLLSEKKLQRSLNNVYNYYKENYALVAQMHFYVLLKKLSDARHSKQQKKITSEAYLNKKFEIQNKLEDWLTNKS